MNNVSFINVTQSSSNIIGGLFQCGTTINLISFTFYNVYVTGFTRPSGQGGMIRMTQNNGCSFNFTSCVFENSTYSTNRGAICFEDTTTGGTFVMSQCTFTNLLVFFFF
jgi:hypothetical protein